MMQFLFVRELMESGGKKLLLAEKKSSVSRATESKARISLVIFKTRIYRLKYF
jgi:hypothetical protein